MKRSTLTVLMVMNNGWNENGGKIPLSSHNLILRLAQCKIVSQHREEMFYSVIAVSTNDLLRYSFLQLMTGLRFNQ